MTFVWANAYAMTDSLAMLYRMCPDEDVSS